MAEKFLRLKAFMIKYANIIFFVGGFVFDSLTLIRIDSKLDLGIQTFYLSMVTLLIIIKSRFDLGLWRPQGRMEKLWEYESEALHFFYGGLLSAYVIFYFKSTTLSRSVFFLGLVAILMFANEMPQVRRAGSAMRLGLYAFCVVSFLNYLLPVMVGSMGTLLFIAGWVLSALIVTALVHHLAGLTPDPVRTRWRLGWSPAAIMALVAILYTMKLIPPVPLSMQYAGIYHAIAKEGDQFKLTYQKPPWYKFWRHDDRDFVAEPGDQVVCFTRVFAPRKFHHQIYLRWYTRGEGNGKWMPSDRIPLSISGGRDEGFRGYGVKSNYVPGKWRVDIETEDGRTLGGVHFNLTLNPVPTDRKWKHRWM